MGTDDEKAGIECIKNTLAQDLPGTLEGRRDGSDEQLIFDPADEDLKVWGEMATLAKLHDFVFLGTEDGVFTGYRLLAKYRGIAAPLERPQIILFLKKIPGATETSDAAMWQDKWVPREKLPDHIAALLNADPDPTPPETTTRRARDARRDSRPPAPVQRARHPVTDSGRHVSALFPFANVEDQTPMPAEPIHRLHNVSDEDQWRRLFAAWRGHLRAVWDHDNNDVPWGYSERTNVGLLASANDKLGGVSMVELPFTRCAGEEGESAGRFDLWLARGRWQVFAEAKQAWVPALNDERIYHVAQKLNEAKAGESVTAPRGGRHHRDAGVCGALPNLDLSDHARRACSVSFESLRASSGTATTNVARRFRPRSRSRTRRFKNTSGEPRSPPRLPRRHPLWPHSPDRSRLMQPTDRARLLRVLTAHVGRVAADLRAQLLVDGPAQDRARGVYSDEKVGEDFAVWTDLLSRRAAVMWVLKSVYARVLEDRGLLSPGRLLDPEAQQLFERLAPNLGETAFLSWVWRDLATPSGGLPELFALQPAEVASPSDALSRELLEIWRKVNPDTGARWSFANETFDGELMGDLYQELDPVVKSQFALCQTPDFVRGFILDRTLTPAIAEHGADAVRIIDPACGSGHFLIDALRRLVAATEAQHPDWRRRKVVEHTLRRVVGMDLNDYACALARARLLMTAADLAGVSSLREAAAFHPQVYWADGLEQVERDEAPKTDQLGLFTQGEEPPPRATLTRPEVRAALREVLGGGFHAVVANPPYIVESDSFRKEYHREKLGRRQRYVSAYRQYSLGSPFTERCFQLAVPAGFVGIITSNNFMKREFGKPLIEEVLAGLDLSLVVDTSQAYIPFHGTPTVLLFGRNRRPSPETSATVRAVMGKRGETGTPDDPATGKVWSSIVKGVDTVGWENEFVSVAEVSRETLGKHPWSLGGGGAAELKERLERGCERLEAKIISAGRVAHTGADDAYVASAQALARRGVPPERVAVFVEGDKLRDWSLAAPTSIVFPYDTALEQVADTLTEPSIRWLWPYKALLWVRREPQGTHREIGFTWHQFSRFHPERYVGITIAFAFVATHNHFVLDHGGKVFNRSAPVIKLPATASEDDHYALLGLLNSSTLGFWMKQTFHAKEEV
jgi:hypothetical protein